ncbi:MAG: hypothetical protein EA392_03545 [Cryomorphaceae bacterium]|nr:MAG: hypothetical protein EA392_03545 [Cryomorphaceae bacterium]
MKTLSNQFSTLVLVCMVWFGFQTDCTGQNARSEWQPVQNLFVSAQQLTPYKAGMSLLTDMADDADIILEHPSGILMFVSNVEELDMDMEDELLYGMRGFNGSSLVPDGKTCALRNAIGMGITMRGELGPTKIAAFRALFVDEAGYITQVVAIQKEIMGALALPEVVQRWIEQNFERRERVLARCGG